MESIVFRSRGFGFSSSESEDESDDIRTTPRSIRPFLDDNGQRFSLITGLVERSCQETLEALTCLATYRDLSDKKINELKNRMLQKLDPSFNYLTENTHIKVSQFLWREWVTKVVRFAAPGPILDVKHLKYLNKTGGWHVCTKEDVARGTIVDTIGFAHGGFGGWFSLPSGEKKFSSFFPFDVTCYHLMAFFRGCPIPLFKQGDRCLYCFREGPNPLYIEAYLKNGGTFVKSVFPILSFTIFDETKIFPVDGVRITQATILTKIRLNFSMGRFEMIEFQTVNMIVVDLAKLFPTIKIPSGAYLCLDKSFLD